MIDDYGIRELDLSPEGIRDCAQLLKVVFPHASHLTSDYLDWQYNRNPAGSAIGFNAWRGTTLAAHYVTIPAAARIAGEPRRGVLSLNTATHPDHQGKKLFTLLAQRTYETAASRGCDFVFGVANANSTPGFLKKLGFQLVGQLEARLGLGAPARETKAAPVAFERAWDQDSLGWRVSNPSTAYRLSSDNSTFRVEAATEKPGIKALLGRFDAGVAPGLAARNGLGFRPITLWIGLDPAIRWGRSLYLEIPGLFRRSPLNLIFKPLREGVPALHREEVRLQAIDFDPY